MIQTIIFDNRADRGYDLYESSNRFPKHACDEILEICNKLGDSWPEKMLPREESWSYRYSPLECGQYLLSVIHRCSAESTDLGRAHNQSVNFLLGKEEAGRLLRQNFLVTAANARVIAGPLLEQRQVPAEDYTALLLKPGADCTWLEGESVIPDEVAFAAAACAADYPPREQILFDVPEPMQELERLLRRIPEPLRTGLSFQTDAIGMQECSTALIFVGNRHFEPTSKCMPRTPRYTWQYTGPLDIHTTLPEKQLQRSRRYCACLDRIGSDLVCEYLFTYGGSFQQRFCALDRCLGGDLSPLLDQANASRRVSGCPAELREALCEEPCFGESKLVRKLQRQMRNAPENGFRVKKRRLPGPAELRKALGNRLSLLWEKTIQTGCRWLPPLLRMASAAAMLAVFAAAVFSDFSFVHTGTAPIVVDIHWTITPEMLRVCCKLLVLLILALLMDLFRIRLRQQAEKHRDSRKQAPNRTPDKKETR